MVSTVCAGGALYRHLSIRPGQDKADECLTVSKEEKFKNIAVTGQQPADVAQGLPSYSGSVTQGTSIALAVTWSII